MRGKNISLTTEYIVAQAHAASSRWSTLQRLISVPACGLVQLSPTVYDNMSRDIQRALCEISIFIFSLEIVGIYFVS